MDAGQSPRPGRPKMFVYKVSALIDLVSVKGPTEGDMLLGLLPLGLEVLHPPWLVSVGRSVQLLKHAEIRTRW